MIAKIIKLDEYLAEIISLNKPSIVQSIIEDMGVNEETAKALYKEMTADQEYQMVSAHLNDDLDDAQKKAVTHSILDPIMASKFNQPFGGVDISEGFNYRREVKNEVARNNLMDWLEEHSLEYLIDNNGNFAVRCPDRKTQYKVNRKFEHTLNRWDRGPVGKNVDPDIHRKGLTPVIDISKLLTDKLAEDEEDLQEAAQDGSMPLPDLSGTPPMFPAKGDKDLTDGPPGLFENTEEGAIKVLGDLINPSSTPHVEKLDEESSEWLVCDDTTERSFYVDTSKGDFEEVEYITEGAGPTYGKGHAPGRLGPRPDDPRGDKHDLPTKFVHGVEVPADTVAELHRKRYEKLLSNVDIDTLIDATRNEKIQLMIDHGVYTADELENPMILDGALKRYNQIVSDYYAKLQKVAEGKSKSAKRREKEAKDRLQKMGPPGSGIASAMAHATKTKKAGAHDDKGYSRKEKHKKDLAKLDESVIGMSAMPTMSINRLRQLAGLPASSITTIEEIPVEEEENREPIVHTGKELRDIESAMDHLNEVFNIYKKLGEDDKKELRYRLITAIMGDGIRLSESVIKKLANEETDFLLESVSHEKKMTDDEKDYLNMVIPDMKKSMTEDIENIDDPIIKPSLARVACVLEVLHKELN